MLNFGAILIDPTEAGQSIEDCTTQLCFRLGIFKNVDGSDTAFE
jgi:hypothetical protein